jgi:hypothetical protein
VVCFKAICPLKSIHGWMFFSRFHVQLCVVVCGFLILVM